MFGQVPIAFNAWSKDWQGHLLGQGQLSLH